MRSRLLLVVASLTVSVVVLNRFSSSPYVNGHVVVRDPDDEPQRHYDIGIPVIPLASAITHDVAVNGSCKNGGCDQWLSRCIQQGIHGSLKRFCDCSYSAVINFQCTPDYLYCGHMITQSQPPLEPIPIDGSHTDKFIDESPSPSSASPASASSSSSVINDAVVPPHGCTHPGCDDWVASCIQHGQPGYKQFCACFQSGNIKFGCPFDSHCGHD